MVAAFSPPPRSFSKPDRGSPFRVVARVGEQESGVVLRGAATT